MLDTKAWRLLWMPASLPYYDTPRSDFSSPALRSFTKRLIFSSWQVVPQAVASVLSYEAERRMMLARDPKANAEARAKMRSLLQFRTVGGRPGAMSTFGAGQPEPALARLTDPLELAAILRGRGAKVTAETIVGLAEERVRKELRSYRQGGAPGRRRSTRTGTGRRRSCSTEPRTRTRSRRSTRGVTLTSPMRGCPTATRSRTPRVATT